MSHLHYSADMQRGAHQCLGQEVWHRVSGLAWDSLPVKSQALSLGSHLWVPLAPWCTITLYSGTLALNQQTDWPRIT